MKFELLPKLENADLICVQGASWYSKTLLKFQQIKGEEKTIFSHIAGVIDPAKKMILEAMPKGVIVNPLDVYVGSGAKVAIYRHRYMHYSTRARIVNYALQDKGKKYGWLKFIPHAIDNKFFGGHSVFRLLNNNKYRDCSEVWAVAYSKAGYNFGCEAGSAQPDDIGDFVCAENSEFECIMPLQEIE
jgi:hypothetical protein